ncbi:proteasome core particle subunit beta 7 [Starmerella bacillaris]|uniref:Proteasome subunit beta n=1 Tax=Starmerella bacillaris TaxID=1247836 RepID=A0AAV5RQE8_STABA|nr:proteasome core particle subunit beta 7 [Starmerella bacillaris]
MQHTQEKWGRPRDDVYGPYDASYLNSEPRTQTLQPTVTGTSVIGMKFNNGVVIAADNLASYGSLRRFIDQERLIKVGSETVVGVGGDVSDLQTIEEIMEGLEISESYDEPAQSLTAPNIHSYLQRIMYKRRSKLDPLWNALVIGGFKNDEPYLAFIDLLGTTYTAPAVASGFGSYLAIPILRKLVDREGDQQNVSKEQAVDAIKEAMKVLFYRDGRALDKYSLAILSKKDGKPDVEILKDVRVENQNWSMAKQIKGFGTQDE